MKMKIIFAVLILIMLVYGGLNFTGFATTKPGETALVKKVVDGDTIKLESGENVRLLGINTPEKGQYYYKEATERLRGLVENKTVSLESTTQDKDKYGRLLRFIIADTVNVDILLVQEGYAFSYMIEPGQKYYEQIISAEQSARIAKLGIWALSEANFSRCIGIQIFNYNAAGDDRYNLNDEYVTMKNACSYPINMTGWTITDSSNERFVFPGFVLQALAKITVHTGSGQNNETQFFWNNTKPIWNNDRDALYLRDTNSSIVIEWNYTSGY